MSGEAVQVKEASARYLTKADAPDVPPGYKRTEIGLFPEEWSVSPLAKLSGFITKGATPTTYGFKWEQRGILFLRSECVSDNGLDLDQSMFISSAANESLRRSEVRDGDILITITGNVGRVVLLRGVGSANINQHIARIRIAAPSVDSGYVYHFLSQHRVRQTFETITTGQAYPQISLQQVRQAVVALPPESEQRAIAEALSDVDGLLGALEALIAKKRAIKQAAMQQLLTGKTRLPGFSGEWETRRLGDIASFFKGLGLSKADLSPDGRMRCIHYGELFTTYGERIAEVLNGTDRDGSYARSVRNDVLMPTSDVTPTGLATASCILLSNVILGGDILVIRAPADVLHGEFLAGAIKVHRSQVMQLVSGTTVFHLYGRDMANFRFLVPNVEEQTAIANVLFDMDTEIAALERRRDKTRGIKQGIMQQLLTGRVRLVKPAPVEAGA